METLIIDGLAFIVEPQFSEESEIDSLFFEELVINYSEEDLEGLED